MRRLRLPLLRQRLLAIVAALAVVGLVAGGALVLVPRRPPAPVGAYGLPLDLDPASPSILDTAVLPERQRRALRPITARPQAVWLTEAAGVEAQVRQRVEGAAARKAVATLVLYRIPGRDCGAYSAPQDDLDAAGYRRWVRAVVAGLGEHRAVLVVEPDALASITCLPRPGRTTRLALLRFTVDRLAAQGSWVYIDAGHSGWRSAATMARRLRQAHVSRATGFSLNVSAYGSTRGEAAYGRAVVRALGRPARVVIDIGRNGAAVARGRWCNPPGARLGAPPTTTPGLRGVDSLLWIKTPGVSDGTCGGGPVAGAFWPVAARRLLRAVP